MRGRREEEKKTAHSHSINPGEPLREKGELERS